MSERKGYEEKVEQLLLPITQEYGVSIYDVEYVKEGADYYLRAYIDKEGGVTIDDCENVSRKLSDALDKDDFIAQAYILEVSSPGLGRTLKKDRHLEQSIGKDVEVKLFEAIDGTKEYAGNLKAYDKTSLTIDIDGQEKVFERSKISIIKLALDF